ncbi:Senescence domain-containing protein [Forsythia ovata]|uniref:Senescence domain-containing protein n=1 Tax=Forsythia ovata TaxID=205694 RepID=A0ABD1TBG7_9LAMI
MRVNKEHEEGGGKPSRSGPSSECWAKCPLKSPKAQYNFKESKDCALHKWTFLKCFGIFLYNGMIMQFEHMNKAYTDIKLWSLARDEAAVKLDESHYFFTLRVPSESNEIGNNILNYGLTIAAKDQERVLRELDEVLEKYNAFRMEKAAEGVEKWWLVAAKDASPKEMEEKKKKDGVEKSAAAYRRRWVGGSLERWGCERLPVTLGL